VIENLPRAEVHVETDAEGRATVTRISGVIDEAFDAARILKQVSPLVVLEVSGIRRITSFGVRQWSEMMKALPGDVRHLYLLGCPAVFVDQLNMVLNFGGRSEVITAYATYFCNKCDREEPVLLDVFGDRAQLLGGQMPTHTCSQCKSTMELAEDPQQYVRLVNTFGAKSVDAPALVTLEKMGLYNVRRTGRSPDATKLVQGEVTLLQLSGTLDDRFRPRRLASGVEGNVVFDLAEVEGVDDQGASSWRLLLYGMSVATSITLVDVPEVLLEPILNGVFHLGSAALYSMRLRYRCTANPDHVDLVSVRLRDGDPPVQTCTRCGQPSHCLASAALITRVRSWSTGSEQIEPAVEQVIASRHELLSRARAESGSVAQTDTLARYRIIRPLSEGGMAEIFLAVHQGIAGFEKLTVLKKISRKMLEQRHIAISMFLNEARIAANLNHPNIVQTFEVGEHGGDLFIAMEYVHGVDLRTLIKEMRKKNWAAAPELILYVGERVAAALHHAHTAVDLQGRSLNIVHRDVSPSNILVGFDGQVKLLDFGVATAIGGDSVDRLIGKFAYMSPEQVRRQQLDGRSDIFSLGVVLWEMVARKQLFRGANDQDTLRAVLSSDVPSLTEYGIPPHMDNVIRKAIVRPMEDRYPDARALETALQSSMRQVGANINAQQVAQLMGLLFPERSASPAVDPAYYKGRVSGAHSVATSVSGPGSAPSPSQSYHFVSSDDTKTVIDSSPERLATAVEIPLPRKEDPRSPEAAAPPVSISQVLSVDPIKLSPPPVPQERVPEKRPTQDWDELSQSLITQTGSKAPYVVVAVLFALALAAAYLVAF
jgi:serine/threonine protein kinase